MNSKDQRKQGIVSSDFKKLNKFIKSIGAASGLVVDVGIMGDKNAREDGSLTNAEIGAKHEFGLGLPKRSFLRMPLQLKSEAILKMVAPNAKMKLANGDTEGVMVDIGIACESIISQAFQTGGFGNWPPDAPATMRMKTRKTILVETTQLADSITSVVRKA